MFMALAACHMPAYASFNGQVLKADVLFPDIATVSPGGFEPGVAVVGPGVDFVSFGLIGADLSASNILLTNVLGSRVTFDATESFNGYQFSDACGSIPDITAVTINGATNLPGFEASQISFDADNIRVDFLPTPVWEASEVVSLDVTFASAQQGTTTTPFFFPQIGEGVAGNIGFSTLVVLENTNSGTSSEPLCTAVTLDFFATPDGAPMPVSIEGRGTAASFDLDLPPGATVFLQTPGTTDPLQVGYARVTGPGGVSGTAIFTRRDGGTVVTKAGVPASGPGTDFSAPIDTTGANNIGLALVNPPSSATGSSTRGVAAANVTLRLYDNDFNLLGTRTFDLAEGEHRPRFVTEADFFGGVAGVDEMTGSVTLESTSPIAAVVLLQDDDPGVPFPADVPILTAFPVSPGRADAIGQQCRR